MLTHNVVRSAIRSRRYGGLAACSLNAVMTNTYEPKPYAAVMIHALQQVGYQSALYAPGLSVSDQHAVYTACCRSRLEFRLMCTDPTHIMPAGTPSMLFTTRAEDATACISINPNIIVVGITNGREPYDLLISGVSHIVSDIPHAIEFIWNTYETGSVK